MMACSYRQLFRRLFFKRFNPSLTPSTSLLLHLCPLNRTSSPYRYVPLFDSSSFGFRVYFSSNSSSVNESEEPAAKDYRSVLSEDEYHKLADETLHGLQEKFEEYGDEIQVDGFDIDYGNNVLTLKLGDMGTYVMNKQTPNRQIWLSSPVSGPSRFDWDTTSKTWIYRRTKANLFQLLEEEVAQLCGKPISLS